MGFWIFMLIMAMLIPFTMIGFGRYFIKTAGPKEINMAFGYRTSMSMKNKDTWAYAHTHCGKLWKHIGWIMLPLSIVLMLFMIGQEIDFVGTYGGILVGAQTIVLIASVFPTEMALRKTFDTNGRRKN